MKFNARHKSLVESRGYTYVISYAQKEKTLDGKNKKGNSIHIRVICPYCKKEYDVSYLSFKNGTNCNHCCNEYENSFAYYIQEELNEPLDKYWDFENNTVNPHHIYKAGTSRVLIKCTNTDYHGSYEVTCNNFHNNKGCSYCVGNKTNPRDSFAQWMINNVGIDNFNKIWSDKNTVDPWKIRPYSTKIIYLKCLKHSYHDEYEYTPSNFVTKSNLYECPQCTRAGGKVHPRDSFGALYPEKAKYWSPRNKKSPFEVTPHTDSKYYHMCEKCGNEFERRISHLNNSNCGVVCRKCGASQGEKKIEYILNKYNVEYETQKSYGNLYGTTGVYLLSYDFYLPKYNLLVEYQGVFHDGNNSCQSKHDLNRQTINDQKKRDYAKLYNINLLEIWYWENDDVESILLNKLTLMN